MWGKAETSDRVLMSTSLYKDFRSGIGKGNTHLGYDRLVGLSQIVNGKDRVFFSCKEGITSIACRWNIVHTCHNNVLIMWTTFNYQNR